MKESFGQEGVSDDRSVGPAAAPKIILSLTRSIIQLCEPRFKEAS